MTDANSTLPFVDALIEVDETLAGVDPTDLDAFGRALQGLAARYMSVDACYLCLWDEQKNVLSFPYNYDVSAPVTVDRPCVLPMSTLPLGSGPTSRAIRSGDSYVMDDTNRPVQFGGVRWGDEGRVSESAIHSPIKARDRKRGTVILGVFSVQSYEPNAYQPHHVRYVEWLARRAGAVLLRDSEGDGLIPEEDARRRFVEELARREISLLNAFVDLFVDLDAGIASLRRSLPELDKRLIGAVDRLDLASKKVQARATCLRTDGGSRQPDDVDRLLATLDPEMLQTLKLLVSDLDFDDIADSLNISPRGLKHRQTKLQSLFGANGRFHLIQRLSRRKLES